MGEIIVYQQNSEIELNSVFPLRSVTKAEHRQDMLSSDEINITFESEEPVIFYVGDKIKYENRFYTLNYAPKINKESDSKYIYDITFEGIRFILKRKVYFNFDGITQTDFEFPLTGEIQIFLYALINNANLIEPGFIWTLGEFPTDTEAKTLTFSNDNCLSALQKICDEYETEFEIIENIAAKTAVINVKEIGKLLPYEFEYGKGKGLYNLKRDNINTDGLITRLYIYGSTENIPTDYRNYKTRLNIPEIYGKNYIQNDEKVQNFGLIEGVKSFDDIKPTFTGIIDSVGTLDNGVQSFTVSNMDFDLKAADANGTLYLIAGNPAKIHINKGNLAGYDFEVNDYNHATKNLKVKQFTDERGQKFPDAGTVFTFGVDDEFVFTDIIMPQSYITAAEEKLLIAGEKAYEKLSQNNVQYTLDTDPNFFADLGDENTKFVGIGDRLTIKDEELFINKTSRVIGLVRDLLEPFKYQISFSDTFEINLIKQFADDITDAKTEIVTVKNTNIQNTLNAYKLQKELKESIFDVNGFLYTDKIAPQSIKTLYLETGDDSQQLGYDGVTFIPNLNGNKNDLKITDGDIIHYLINPTATTWQMLEYNGSLQDDERYYIYAKCSRTTNVGTFEVTKEQISVEADPDAYTFLLALLHTPQAGVRTITLLNGTTTIQGGYIRTKKISSIDGSTWFDLDDATFNLNNNGGMSGRIDPAKGLDTIGLWLGESPQNKDIAPFRVSLDGKTTATKLKIKSTYPGTNAGVTIDKGLIEIRRANDSLAFEFGVTGIDELAFNIYNSLGIKIAQIGESGINFIGYMPESYTVQKMALCSNQTNSAQRKLTALSHANLIVDQNDGNLFYYLQGTMETTYQYHAGYNFESAMNSVYEGKIYYTQNKLGGFVADGWYEIYFEKYIQQTPTVYKSVVLYKIENGIITDTDMAIETVNWSEMIII